MDNKQVEYKEKDVDMDEIKRKYPHCTVEELDAEWEEFKKHFMKEQKKC